MAKIDLRNVSVEYPIYNVSSRSLKKQFLRVATGGTISKDSKQHVVVRSLNDISLSIGHGDRVGLMGHNGSGKSTLLKLLARVYEPTSGRVKIDGNISPMLDLCSGIEAEFTGYENIVIRGTILGLTHRQIKQQINEIADFTGLGDYLYMPVRTYSSGMMVRLAFAISTCIKPDIMLIDEVFGAGDTNFMQKARAKLVSMLNQSSIVVIASHITELVKEFCDKAILLEEGRLKFFGDIDTAIEIYKQTLDSAKQ